MVRAFKTRMATSMQTSAPVKDSCQTPEAVEDSGDDSMTTTCGDDDATSYLNSMDDSWEDSEDHFLKETEYFNISTPRKSPNDMSWIRGDSNGELVKPSSLRWRQQRAQRQTAQRQAIVG